MSAEKILFLTHTQADGTLSKAALETLAGAIQLSKEIQGSELVAGLIGDNLTKAANSIASAGASKIYGVSGEAFSASRYSTDAAAIQAIAAQSGATLVLAPTTPRLQRAVPGAAVRVKGQVDTHVTGFQTASGKLEIQRWFYRQRIVTTLSRAARPWFLMVDSGVFKAYSGADGSASIEKIDVQITDDLKRTQVLGFEAPQTGTQTIRPDAKVLFVAGAGWTKKQTDGQVKIKVAEEIIKKFLQTTDSSLGSSKSLVDQTSEGQAVISLLTHMNQIGQTGMTPRHPKGLSTCCHGEEPHVVGWRFINERRAINTNPACGWAQGKADVLYVADAFEVIPEVAKILEQSSLKSQTQNA